MPRARLEKRSVLWPGFSCSRRFAPLFRQARLAAFGKLRRAQTMICLDAYGFMQDLAVDFFNGFAIERPGIQLLMRARISCSRAGTRSAMPRAPFSRPTSSAKLARTFSRCSRVVSIASIFARQSQILISLIPLLPLHRALIMSPKTKKAAFPLRVAAGLEDLVRFLVAKC